MQLFFTHLGLPISLYTILRSYRVINGSKERERDRVWLISIAVRTHRIFMFTFWGWFVVPPNNHDTKITGHR